MPNSSVLLASSIGFAIVSFAAKAKWEARLKSLSLSPQLHRVLKYAYPGFSISLIIAVSSCALLLESETWLNKMPPPLWLVCIVTLAWIVTYILGGFVCGPLLTRHSGRQNCRAGIILAQKLFSLPAILGTLCLSAWYLISRGN